MTIHTLTPARAAEQADTWTRKAGEARRMASRARTEVQRDNWLRVARAREAQAERYRKAAGDPAERAQAVPEPRPETVDLSAPFDPADYPHVPDPAQPVTLSQSGAPGEATTEWAVCVHCQRRYPVAQNFTCTTRTRPITEARNAAILAA